MASKNQNNKSSGKVCEKLRNAMNFSPFRRFYRASNQQQSHSAPTPQSQITNNPIKPHVSQPSPMQFIPIETAAQGGGKLIKPKVDKISTSTNNKLMFPENNGVVHESNETFAEYITRVRNGMRTSSDLGIERIPTKKIARRDSLNDRVSNFLNLAKIKYRTTSSNGHDMHGNQNQY